MARNNRFGMKLLFMYVLYLDLNIHCVIKNKSPHDKFGVSLFLLVDSKNIKHIEYGIRTDYYLEKGSKHIFLLK